MKKRESMARHRSSMGRNDVARVAMVPLRHIRTLQPHHPLSPGGGYAMAIEDKDKKLISIDKLVGGTYGTIDVIARTPKRINFDPIGFYRTLGLPRGLHLEPAYIAQWHIEIALGGDLVYISKDHWTKIKKAVDDFWTELGNPGPIINSAPVEAQAVDAEFIDDPQQHRQPRYRR
jgi:hypothetical protein